MARFDQFLEDALSGGESPFDYGTPSDMQSYLIEFNHRASELVGRYGVDPIGKAIWYLYSCASNTTYDALDPSADSTVEKFYDSIQCLYDDGFCPFCENRIGHSNVSGHYLATACYMLWDMDSGLEYLTFRGRPELFSYGERLINFGLSHAHAACQESFLHCLGHLHHRLPDFVQAKVTFFLRRDDISPEARIYAEECASGMIM